MQSLQTQLRRRSIDTPAAALLLTAAAQQACVPVHAELAAAALSATPAPSTFSIAIATLMSNTALKIACAAVVLIATPLVLERKANASLRTEIAQIRSVNPQSAGTGTETDALAKSKSALAATRTARLAAENRTFELLDLKKKVETEVVISLGSVDTMAKKLARVMKVMNSLKLLQKKAASAPVTMEQRKKFEEEMMSSMGDMLTMVGEIRRIEKSPEKAARFYATLCGEAAELDEPGRTLVETHARDWMRGIQNEGLALPQRPKGKAPEWDARRKAATKRLVDTLASQLPPQKPDVPPLEEILDMGEIGELEMMTGGEGQ